MYKKLVPFFDEFDAVLLTSAHNMRYFSGFSGGEGAVLIQKDKQTLFADSRYIEQAENEAENFDVVLWNGFIDLCSFTEEQGFEKIAFEDNILTVDLYNRLKERTKAEYIGKGNEIDKLRMIKTVSEIEKIKTAEEIGDKTFSHILGYIKEGVSEREIACEIEYFMKKQGAEKTSFDTIAISGAKTSMPHGVPDNKKIENGDFITLDFGCVYDGYCSDMTRTVVLGKASEKQKEIYDIVYTAQMTGLDAIKCGEICKNADKAARDVIEKSGYGECFGHSLGHGVGLLIHELPNLSPKSDIILEDNMVVSCEPGIYVPGFGGVRIEDLVVVSGKKCTVLSKSQKNLIEI